MKEPKLAFLDELVLAEGHVLRLSDLSGASCSVL
jgi:hypothetical protein